MCVKPSKTWYWSFAVAEKGSPPLTQLECAAPCCDFCHPQPRMCQAFAKYKPTEASLLKSCCFCACSQLQTAAVNPGLIFLLFCRMKSSLSGHTRRSSHPSALSQAMSQGRARVRDAVRGVRPCPRLRHPQRPPQPSGGIQGYLSLQWGVSEACKECNREISGPCPAPSPPAWEEIGCRFRACEGPDLCSSQMRPGGSDGFRALLVTFLPSCLALTA